MEKPDMTRFSSLVPIIARGEQGISGADHEPEHSLYVALTEFDLQRVKCGLSWLAILYGEEMVFDLWERLNELVSAQRFCDCEKCQAEHEEAEHGS